MAITYMSDVPNSSVRSFLRLIFRWKGSVWKMVWRELLVWLVIYGVLNLVYRFVLTSDQQMYLAPLFDRVSLFRTFENLCQSIFISQDFFPLTFLLGFFVTKTIDRCFSLAVAGYIAGNDFQSRVARRTIVRYMSLAQTLVYRDISPIVRQRFPTLEAVKFAGFCNKNELKAFESVSCSGRKYWVPIKWALVVVTEARNDGLIKNDFAVQDINRRILKFRHNLFRLAMYDWAPIPLLYTQVVMFGVRLYFFLNLLARQSLATDRFQEARSPLTFYIPAFSILEFVFHMGWLKVAESLLNPFGGDDEDFAVNMLIDRNLKVGMEIVDDSFEANPPLEKDIFWAERVPEHLYTAQTARTPVNPQFGSAVTQVPPRDCVEMVARVDPLDRADRNEDESVPIVVRRDSDLSEEGLFSGFTQMLRHRHPPSRSVPSSPPTSTIRRIEGV
ncbi:hypothetical protein QR680_005764 [Steinernema hermaphroditum]|uniref:Bestrophin homolog n=1 Tax=Steinernema hermaphroditum TaxID=289476 RepID=A0AA39HVF4_9BILA|nr:hypothetical protein QR680_005764 [Steinernema hermaphroditum]